MTVVQTRPPWTEVERIPFAAPLRAVDRIRVADGDGGLTIVVTVVVDPQDANLRGHFPGLPIYPGIFVVETLVQAMALALGGRPVLRRLTSIRFLAAVLGGDELELTIEATESADGRWETRAVGRRLDGTVTTRLRAVFLAAAAGGGPDSCATALDAPGSVMDAAQIRAALPQRHPLLLVDRVLAREPGKRIETVKTITATEPCYAGLDDRATIDDYAYPVSLLIESFGQSAALLWLDSSPSAAADQGEDGVLLFVGAREYTVEGHAFPGDVVRHVVHLDQVVANTAFATGESWVGDRRIATVGTLMAARRPAGALGPAGTSAPVASQDQPGRIPQPSQ